MTDDTGLAKDMAAVRIDSAVTAELSSLDEADEREREEYEKDLDALFAEFHRRSKGSLYVLLSGPARHSARTAAQCWWSGDDSDLYMGAEEEARAKGFVAASHPSFELYRRRQFYAKPQAPRPTPGDEDTVLLDVEAEAKYDHVYGGTISVEGFGMEWWDWEIKFGPKRPQTFRFTRGTVPPLSAIKMLRRMAELAAMNTEEDPEVDDKDLEEFFGIDAFLDGRMHSAAHHTGLADRIRSLYSFLNRDDVFVDFTTRSVFSFEQVAVEEKSRGMNVWDLFFQMITGRELARRLEKLNLATADSMTPRVFASVLLADAWFRGSKIELTDSVIDPASFKKGPSSDGDEKAAEKLRKQAKKVANRGRYFEAVELYTEAIATYPQNPKAWLRRGLAHAKLGDMMPAREDAYAATKLDPRNADAWAQLGAAEMHFENWERAKHAYGRAVDLSGPRFKPKTEPKTTVQRLVDMAQARLDSEAQKVQNATDPLEKKQLQRLAIKRAWDPELKAVNIRSQVHERQAEGLIYFAERLQWPYLEELRGYAPKAYAEYVSGGPIRGFLHDWFYGLTLPGKWMALKIMGAMILCTPSMEAVDLSTFPDSGAVVEGPGGESCSYWRSRTALGRILAPLPGVVSLCGWVGRCPGVELVSSATTPLAGGAAEKKLRHVRVKAERIVPISIDLESDEARAYHHEYATRLTALSGRPGEDKAEYLATMHDPAKWVVPRPKAQRDTPAKVALGGIRLTRLPWSAERQREVANGTISEDKAEMETEYEARITFRVGEPGHEKDISYAIKTNPLLISLPPCKPPDGAEGHAVQEREREQHEAMAWPVDRLEEYDGQAEKDGKVLVIDARSDEAEVMARAWCAERGRHAVVWRDGSRGKEGDGARTSCCYTCAVRAAGRGALWVGVVIWTV
ncbi:hypothetical protein ACRALDRAFT_1083463 [Sodiomyces alcalophilus JCM 7366]|uniref:uncharacterized protein n=1 Tax=Sodiomyces alcalophilus JCM 7366 TaxID=591952 RepID=UPI0039B5667A